jgi:hypothetical protein
MQSFAARAGSGVLATAWLGIARPGTAKHNTAAALPPRLAGVPTLPEAEPRTALVVRKGRTR